MSNYTIDTSAPILVTGATGYVAGWIVKRLLEGGATVHAAVRDPSNEAKVAHLRTMEGGTLKLFKADLLDEGSFDEAAQGCGTVFHTASPFTTMVKDPQRDMVDPALLGTKNVLNAANKAGSVKRVVVTSSCVAIYGDAKDIQDYPNQTMTEAQWNTTSTLDHQVYPYSKVLAEKAAWEIAEAQDQWTMTTINPGFIVGPATAAQQSSESFAIIRQAGDGTMKQGTAPAEIGMVDVRDVAEAHLRAAFVEGASGRYITCHKTLSFLEIGQSLAASFGDEWPFPKRAMPKWLMWLVGPMVSPAFSRKMISNNMNYPWRFDNSKIRNELGMEFGSIDVALKDMFQQMIDSGAVSKP